MYEEEKIKRLVSYYTKLYDTRDPFEIATRLRIVYQIGNIGHAGCYMFLKNRRCIFLNNDLNEHELRLVMAHELGHAILDKKENCYFIRNKTLLLVSKIERRANLFAAHLLITDEMLAEFQGYTKEQFCNCTGYPKELLELRLNQTS